jgi:NitT/TauT family transport system ATP-binding protein
MRLADIRTHARAVQFGHSVHIESAGMIFHSRTGSVEALQDIDLRIRGGEFMSIVGPSGCGKSTLLRLVAGLAQATSGRVFLGERAIDAPQTNIGIVFQKPVLLDWRTVLANVMLQAEARKLDRQEYLARARRLLAKVGLGDFEDAYPFELSGGMSQRVAVCRALLHSPPLLLMDEPFGALDALTRDQMMIDLQRLWLDTRQTVLFVTHSVAEAIFLSDRVVVMTPRPGRIQEIIDIDLPRPRRLALRSSPEFHRAADRILGLFETMGILHEEDDPADGVAAPAALTEGSQENRGPEEERS